jgi:BirA family biotin operon repressor/biotin-[acetyl-CoA-carboxylase] ligase
MTADAAMARGARAFLGVPVERHAVLSSTNDEIFRRAVEGAPEGLVVVADTQTAGRGRHGRTWQDASGRSLLFSVLLKPALPVPSWPLLALAMAASVAEIGGEAARTTLGVKWPNDVVSGARKICGVLAESRGGDGARGVLVIGTGVNVNQDLSDFPAELRGRATSLRLEAGGGPRYAGAGGDPGVPRDLGAPIDFDALLAAILDRFADRLALVGAESAGALFQELRHHLPAAGARVTVRIGGRVIDGTVESVLETGALRLRNSETGAVETVAAGELA